jgi:hypothetical protein
MFMKCSNSQRCCAAYRSAAGSPKAHGCMFWGPDGKTPKNFQRHVRRDMYESCALRLFRKTKPISYVAFGATRCGYPLAEPPIRNAVCADIRADLDIEQLLPSMLDPQQVSTNEDSVALQCWLFYAAARQCHDMARMWAVST